MLRQSNDQAASLRRNGGAETLPLIAVASGKGGVGKTFLAINLAMAMRQRGVNCALVDMDWGLANVDVALGLAPTRHLGHVLAGTCALEAALTEYCGVPVLPNACGEELQQSVTAQTVYTLLGAIRRSLPEVDAVIADTHPGIGAATTDVLAAASAIAIVTTPEPTSVTDTYALLKVLNERGSAERAGIVVNQAGSAQQAAETARHLDAVCRRFLHRPAPVWGCVLQDATAPRCVREQEALLRVAPRSSAARGVRELAGRLAAASLHAATTDRQVAATGRERSTNLGASA